MKKGKVEKIIETAVSLLGSPYKYGAYLQNPTNDQKEFDCSSFVQYVYAQAGIELPRSTILQAAALGVEIRRSFQPADLLFFEGERGHYRHDLFPGRKIYIGHVAIYIGAYNIIHAVNSYGFSGVVKQSIASVNEHPSCNLQNIVLAKRYIVE